jgi:hypothetical protein
MLVTGLLRSRDGRLTKMAEKVAYTYKKPSLISRFQRFIRSSWVTVNQLYKPLVTGILQTISANEPLVLLIDSTRLGGRCICLMVSVYYKNRAIPIAWCCLKGRKGHTPQAAQLELLQHVRDLLPDNSAVVLVGDGEFDGTELLTWLINEAGWDFVCHTSHTHLLLLTGKWLSLAEIVSDLALAPGQTTLLTQCAFTRQRPSVTVNIFIAWHHIKQRHIFFVTNCTTAAEAKEWYDHRFTIETCFADLKSRGFNLDLTRIRTPERLERFLLAAAFAYYLVILFGIEAIFSGIFSELVRTDAFYHSLSQLGFILLDDILNQGDAFPDLGHLPAPYSVPHIVLPP